MKIETFSTANTRTLQQRFLAKLQEAAEEFGVTVEAAGGSIAPSHATLKFKVTATSPVAKDHDDREQEVNLNLIGLGGQLGKEFKHNGHSFKVTGANLGRPSFPVMALRSDGKAFKFPAGAVARALGVQLAGAA
jgi:hypothetical protein